MPEKSINAAVQCRAASADEYGAAAQLRHEMSVETGHDFDARAADWRDRFRAYFAAKQAAGVAQLFLAYDGADPVGCAVISILDEYRRCAFGTLTAFVNCVYVRPAYRRSGIGRRLMELAIAWAVGRGCVRVRLRTSDEGRRLYESLGFHTGREMELDLA
jgi:GNAT superfamily N-acetyltransferase